jgi:hypothetical protein
MHREDSGRNGVRDSVGHEPELQFGMFYGESAGGGIYELDGRRGRGAYDFRRGRTGWVEAGEVAVTLAVSKVKLPAKTFHHRGHGEHRGILIHVWYWSPEIAGG